MLQGCWERAQCPRGSWSKGPWGWWGGAQLQAGVWRGSEEQQWHTPGPGGGLLIPVLGQWGALRPAAARDEGQELGRCLPVDVQVPHCPLLAQHHVAAGQQVPGGRVAQGSCRADTGTLHRSPAPSQWGERCGCLTSTSTSPSGSNSPGPSQRGPQSGPAVGDPQAPSAPHPGPCYLSTSCSITSSQLRLSRVRKRLRDTMHSWEQCGASEGQQSRRGAGSAPQPMAGQEKGMGMGWDKDGDVGDGIKMRVEMFGIVIAKLGGRGGPQSSPGSCC